MHVACDNMRSTLLNIVGNKILNLHSGCTATVGRHKIRSTVSHNQTFSIEEHRELLDLQHISQTKLKQALHDLGFSKHQTLGHSSDLNETNKLHLNSETLKNYLKDRHEQWTARELTNSFRTDMKNDQKTSNYFIYALALVVSTLFILIIFIIVRKYIITAVLNWAQRKNNQVENQQRRVDLSKVTSSGK